MTPRQATITCELERLARNVARDLPAAVETSADDPRLAEWERELDRCRADEAHFIDAHCVIEERHDVVGMVTSTVAGEVPFKLWDAQRDALRKFGVGRLRIVLKARQLGLSWLAIARRLHRSIFRRSQLTVCYSITEDEAKDLIHRCRFMYDRLPEFIKQTCPLRKGADSVTELGWANGSTIRARAATKSAGRSFTASEVIMDEAAHMQHAKPLYDAALRAVEAGGELTIISTANGQGGLFFDVWQGAYAGLNDFAPIFIPWQARPGRDAEWYARQLRNATDPAVIPQEYPGTPEEAFLATGRVRFPDVWLKAQAPNVARGMLPRSAWPKALADLDLKGGTNRLEVYGLPLRHRDPIIGGDCAEGIPGLDLDAAVCVDRNSGEELAVLRGHWEPDEYAGFLAALADAYGAPVIVERNNHGHAVLLALKQINVARSKAGQRPVRVLAGLDGRPGWLTNGATKEPMIGKVAEYLRDGRLIVRSKLTLGELQDYRYLDDGSLGCSAGKHDDLVMAHGTWLGWTHMRPKGGGFMAGGEPVSLVSESLR